MLQLLLIQLQNTVFCFPHLLTCYLAQLETTLFISRPFDQSRPSPVPPLSPLKCQALADNTIAGAGPTPYSRRSDGFAVLRSSVREFLASEAMHALGVPTTRALSLCLSGREVVRGIHYDGSREPGAVVCRMAPSFIRFGSFEILYARGEMLLLEQLADYVIQEHFTQLVGRADRQAELLKMIVQRTARLAAAWQSNGFCHGASDA